MKANFVGREMFKKQSKRFLTMALCAGMALSNLGGVTAFAAGDSNDSSQTTDVTAKTINVGANAMKIPEDGWKKSTGQYLYYGIYKDTPVKYRVLDRHDGNSSTKFDNGTSTMTISGGTGNYLLIDSETELFKAAYDESEPVSGNYNTSDIVTYLKNGTDADNNGFFSTAEASAIALTDLNASSEEGYLTGNTYVDVSAKENKSFLLSMKEINELYAGESNANKVSAWWTRSYPSADSAYAGIVSNGRSYYFKTNAKTFVSVLPASNLDLSYVLFTTSKEADKTSSTLTSPSKTAASEWKTTLKDSSKKVNTTDVTREGQKVTLSYTYEGENVDQISLVITSGDLDSTASTVLYYSKLADAAEKSGTVSFDLPIGLSSESKVYILAEDINDWMCTDYASAPAELTIPASETPEPEGQTYTVTFDSQGGSNVDAQSVKSNEQASKPTDPTKAGAAFDGWYKDAEYTEAYDFSDPVKSSFTLYAKWTAGQTSSIENYDSTNSETVDANKKDVNQQNVQASSQYTSSSDGFLYKSVEWEDKSEGIARITISTKNADVNPQSGAVYVLCKCTAHKFELDTAAENIAFLAKAYGSVDLVIADGYGYMGALIVEDVTETNTDKIKESVLNDITFRSSAHFSISAYYGLARYLKTHDPYAIYVSFDMAAPDTYSSLPANYKDYDIWETLREYYNDGRYFSMSESTDAVTWVDNYDTDMTYAFRVGLANPNCFGSFDDWSVKNKDQAKPLLDYKQNFEELAKKYKVIPESFTIKDTVSDKFEILDVTTNKSGVTTDTTGQKVEVSFADIDSSSVAEVYITVKLKDEFKKEGSGIYNSWDDTNDGSATVTYTDTDGNVQEKSVESPELCYVPTYAVSTEITGGTIDPKVNLNEGDSTTISFKPNDGFWITSVTVDQTPVDVDSLKPNADGTYTYDFNDVKENHEIKVVCETEYEVTTSVTDGSVDDCQVVKSGDTTTIKSKPNPKYKLKSVKVDGKEIDITTFEQDEEGYYSYSFENITSDHDIAFVYEPETEVTEDQIRITTSVTGGTISGGSVWTKNTPIEGLFVSYKPQDDTYVLKSVTVNGEPVSVTDYPESYPVNTDHDWDVVVVFAPQYTITTKVNDIEGGTDGGTITESEKKFKGENKTVDITSNDGYRIKTVTVDGVDVTETVKTNNNTYTFENISDDHTINVVFEKIPEFKITTTVNGKEGGTDGGTITPTATVPDNGTSTITIKPDPGYIVTTVTIDGKEVPLTDLTPNEDGSYSYTFPNVDKDHSVDVKYVKQCTITTNVVNGTIDESVTVNQGDTKTINYKPQDDTYVLKSVTIDKGTDTEQVIDLTAHPEYAGSYTFEGVAHDHSIDVVYARQYTITTSVENGKIDPTQVVWEGDKATINYTPDEGYVLKSVKVNGKEVDITKFPNSYTFENLDGDASIEVVYAKTESLPKDKLTIETSVKNGTITPSVSVNKGDDMTVTYKAKDGYKLSKVLVDGKEVDITKYPTGYTFKSVSANHTIKVVFVKATGIAAKTGDTMAPIAAVSVLCLAAAAGAIALVLVRRKRNA